MSLSSPPPASVQNQLQTNQRKAPRFVLLFGLGLWALLASAGLWWLWGYQNTPGLASITPSNWPSKSRIQLARNEHTLVMLAHPRCPCTRASIGELAKIMAHSQGRLRAYVLFIKPSGSTPDWETTDLWQTASEIPGVNVVKDDDGIEARIFNAATSGHTVLYDHQGGLVFSGGITASRGHFGDNVGESAIISIVNAQVPTQTETSVFGCPLFNPQSECRVKIDEPNHQ